MDKINIFYQEPDNDRWFKYDRYLRSIVRKIVRGPSRPGGQMMVAINLLKGLDKLGIQYRFNDFAYAKRNPNKLIGVIGKSNLIFENKFKNPILFGASIFSHPLECPDLFNIYPNIKKILVPGPWIKAAFDEYYGDENVIAWPTGIDTYHWNESIKDDIPEFDFLIYDKVMWNYENTEHELINPIREILNSRNLTFETIRYGFYEPDDLKKKVARCKSVIFLCEHETQGIACQQISATNTPILAWDKGGYWQDPEYYPDRVKFTPVSSVPYWHEKCGEKFTNLLDFSGKLDLFTSKKSNYQPASYIENTLSLEKCALDYANIYNDLDSKLHE